MVTGSMSSLFCQALSRFHAFCEVFYRNKEATGKVYKIKQLIVSM